MAEQRGAGTEDDPHELESIDGGDESDAYLPDLTDDEDYGKAETVIKPEPTVSSAPPRKKRRSGYMYRQPKCRLVAQIKQHPVWKNACSDVRRQLASRSAGRSGINTRTVLNKLLDDRSQWGCIDKEQPRGTEGPCAGCVELDVECLVEVMPADGGEAGSLQVTSSGPTRKHMMPIRKLQSGPSSTKPRTNGGARGYKRKAIAPDTDQVHPSSKEDVISVSEPPTRKPRITLTSRHIIAEPALDSANPLLTSGSTQGLSNHESSVSVLEDVGKFISRMKIILAEDDKMEFETVLMFKKVEEHVALLERSRNAVTKADTEQARASLKYVQRFTQELRNMSTKDGELSFRMEIMFDTMDGHIKSLQSMLGLV